MNKNSTHFDELGMTAVDTCTSWAYRK